MRGRGAVQLGRRRGSEVGHSLQGVVRCGIWLGEVGDQQLPGTAGHGQTFPGNGQFADGRGVDSLGAAGLRPNVVSGPQAGEVGAVEAKFADEVHELGIVEVPAGRGS